MKKSKSERVFQVFNYTFLGCMSFLFVYPFWRIFILSLNEGIDAAKGGINFWPRKFTLDNYIVLFSRNDIMNAYTITIARTVAGTVLSVLLMAMMAYGLSKQQVKGRKVINTLLLITMFFSGGLIPTYLLYLKLKIFNTFWVYILPCLYSASNVFIMRTFFRAFSVEIEESAKIDGANDLTVFFKIVFPLSMPIIATMALFMAVGHWNDYMTGVLFINDSSLLPLQTVLMKIINEGDSTKFISQGGLMLEREKMKTMTTQSIRMATLMVVVLPIMCIYPFLQKYFVKGVMIGSLKG